MNPSHKNGLEGEIIGGDFGEAGEPDRLCGKFATDKSCPLLCFFDIFLMALWTGNHNLALTDRYPENLTAVSAFEITMGLRSFHLSF